LPGWKFTNQLHTPYCLDGQHGISLFIQTNWHLIGVPSAVGTNQYSLFFMPVNEFLERPVAIANVGTLNVSNVSYTITLPTSITLPKEGCSGPQTANISPMTPSQVSVRVGTGSLSSLGMFLRDNGDSIVFLANSTSSTFYLCSNANAASTTVVPIDVVGNASVQYLTNVSSISVTLTNSTTPSAPTIQTPSFSGQSVTTNVTSDRTGTLYWTFQEGSYSTPAMNLTDIQSAIASSTNKTKIVQSQADYLAYLYSGPRDLRIGATDVNASQNSSLVFADLLPNTTYTLCSYFTSSDNSVTSKNASCTQMISPSDTWKIYKTLLTFSNNQTAAQRNSLLCAFAKQIGINSAADYKYILNQEGESCNTATSATAPNTSWYFYSGITYDNSSQVIYLLTIDNSTKSQSQATNFIALFDNTTNILKNPALQDLSSSVNSTLNKGEYLGSSNYSIYRDQSREVSFGNVTYNNTKQIITIQNITFSATAAVYFVVQPNTTANPSLEQVLNCRDGNGTTAVQCFRLVGAKGSTVFIAIDSEQPSRADQRACQQ
jgi:hypothetical protein